MEEINISHTITAKSDQLNYTDLVAGDKLITITNVKVVNDPQQPVWIYYDGDSGKPWKPCLSYRRVLIECWGVNAAQYIGRQILLFGDSSVEFGKEQVGGIRIKSLSHIDADKTIIITVKRGVRRKILIKALETKKLNQITDEQLNDLKQAIVVAQSMPELQKIAKEIKALELDAESKEKIMPFYQEKLTELKK
jgi:hypothetical protein